MPDNKVIIINACLIGAGVFGIISCKDKKFAVAGFVLVLADGLFGLLNRGLDIDDVSDVDKVCCTLNESCGCDLLTAEICLANGVEQTYCLLLLIPALLDVIMRYALEDPIDLRNIVHVAFCIAMGYFAVTKENYILLAPAVLYLIPALKPDHEYKDVAIAAGAGLIGFVLANGGGGG